MHYSFEKQAVTDIFVRRGGAAWAMAIELAARAIVRYRVFGNSNYFLAQALCSSGLKWRGFTERAYSNFLIDLFASTAHPQEWFRMQAESWV
jgi:hypothetical protein